MTIHRYAGLVLAAASFGGLAAQSGFVSPPGYRDSWAFNEARGMGQGGSRQMQIHTDVPAMNISSISWRPTLNPTSQWIPVTTCQLHMGEGDYASRSATFLSNFATSPVQVVANRLVSWRRWTGAAPNPQDAFIVRLPFDRPFAYTHTRDLVWMIDFPPSNSLPIQTDWAVRDRDTVITGEQQGVGCFNTWDNRLAELRGDVAATQNASAFKVSLACSGLRPNSLTHVLLGASPTATYYSFLCGFQYVDNVLLGALTVSDASGGIASREFARIPYQVPLVGLSAHAQAYCLDDGRHPALLPVTLTNGLRLEFPLMAPTWHSATWVAGNAYAATGGGLNDGMIAVTQFTQ